jgi:hypothetical protein
VVIHFTNAMAMMRAVSSSQMRVLQKAGGALEKMDLQQTNIRQSGPQGIGTRFDVDLSYYFPDGSSPLVCDCLVELESVKRPVPTKGVENDLAILKFSAVVCR